MTVPYFLEEHRDVSFLSSFKTQAKSRYYMDITDREKILLLPIVYEFAHTHHLPIIMIGGGTNCLFAFDLFEGIIIHNRYTGYTEPYEHGGAKYIRVHSGEMSTVFALALYQHYGISTLVPWTGLPGTMGWACIGNAGCFGVEMSDIMIEAEVLELESGIIHTYTHDDMHYHYRESILKGDERFFVISVLLDVSSYHNEPYGTYTPQDIQAIRKVKQPPGLSCGSFFKNPKPLSAGKLIDDTGLLGTRFGGVKVSERHGNFFINDQKWTWQDVIALRDLVKSKVQEKYHLELEEEVRIVKNP